MILVYVMAEFACSETMVECTCTFDVYALSISKLQLNQHAAEGGGGKGPQKQKYGTDQASLLAKEKFKAMCLESWTAAQRYQTAAEARTQRAQQFVDEAREAFVAVQNATERLLKSEGHSIAVLMTPAVQAAEDTLENAKQALRAARIARNYPKQRLDLAKQQLEQIDENGVGMIKKQRKKLAAEMREKMKENAEKAEQAAEAEKAAIEGIKIKIDVAAHENAVATRLVAAATHLVADTKILARANAVADAVANAKKAAADAADAEDAEDKDDAVAGQAAEGVEEAEGGEALMVQAAEGVEEAEEEEALMVQAEMNLAVQTARAQLDQTRRDNAEESAVANAERTWKTLSYQAVEAGKVAAKANARLAALERAERAQNAEKDDPANAEKLKARSAEAANAFIRASELYTEQKSNVNAWANLIRDLTLTSFTEMSLAEGSGDITKTITEVTKIDRQNFELTFEEGIIGLRPGTKVTFWFDGIAPTTGFIASTTPGGCINVCTDLEFTLDDNVTWEDDFNDSQSESTGHNQLPHKMHKFNFFTRVFRSRIRTAEVEQPKDNPAEREREGLRPKEVEEGAENAKRPNARGWSADPADVRRYEADAYRLTTFQKSGDVLRALPNPKGINHTTFELLPFEGKGSEATDSKIIEEFTSALRRDTTRAPVDFFLAKKAERHAYGLYSDSVSAWAGSAETWKAKNLCVVSHDLHLLIQLAKIAERNAKCTIRPNALCVFLVYRPSSLARIRNIPAAFRTLVDMYATALKNPVVLGQWKLHILGPVQTSLSEAELTRYVTSDWPSGIVDNTPFETVGLQGKQVMTMAHSSCNAKTYAPPTDPAYIAELNEIAANRGEVPVGEITLNPVDTHESVGNNQLVALTAWVNNQCNTLLMVDAD